MLPQLLSLSGALASLALIVCALAWGVIPILTAEKPDSTGRRAWIDLWIPLLLAWPLVIAAINMDPVSARHATGPWVIVALPVASTMLALAISMGVQFNTGERVDALVRAPDLELLHAWALTAVAALLALAAIVGRVDDWHGNFMLAAAVAWLWMMSSDPATGHGSRSVDDETRGASPGGVFGLRKPIFVLDWADRAGQSLHVYTMIALCVGVIGLGVGARLSPPESGTILGLMAALAPLPVIVAVAARLDAASARRTTASTIILIVLIPLGVFASRLVPWRSLAQWNDPNADFMAGTLQLTGLSVLLPCAIAVATLAGLAVSPKPWSRRGWALVFAIVAILIAIVGFAVGDETVG